MGNNDIETLLNSIRGLSKEVEVMNEELSKISDNLESIPKVEINLEIKRTLVA
jgi:nitrate reductase NapAB chaperone NapD